MAGSQNCRYRNLKKKTDRLPDSRCWYIVDNNARNEEFRQGFVEIQLARLPYCKCYNFHLNVSRLAGHAKGLNVR